MKLIELAQEHNLDQELLREVVEEDLSIALPEGMETGLDHGQVRRILACDGLETVDGEEFAPIIADEYLEKHKRSQAAKKAAETRRRKEAEAKAKAKAERDLQIEEERRKHEEELARREAEEEERRVAEEKEEEERERQEQERIAFEEEKRQKAETELLRREDEAKRLSEELANLRRQEAQLAAAMEGGNAPTGKAGTATATDEAPTEAAEKTAEAEAKVAEAEAKVAEAKAAAGVDAEAPAETPEAEAPASDASETTKRLGSRLASLAKATAEKSDHRTKDKAEHDLQLVDDPKVGSLTGDDDQNLSVEDRRRIIQGNIRRNIQMQERVKAAKATDRKKRFRTIDRSKGGPALGGPGGRGGPGGPRGPRRDRRDRRLEKSELQERQGPRGKRPLSTEEVDLSGKTEFTVALPCTVRDFSEASGIKASVVIAKLFMAGVMANINSVMERDAIELVAQEFEKKVTIKEEEDVEEVVESLHEVEDDEDDLAPRPPVVTILGHVDHGKTSLLDAIRKTEVTADEAGGITQHVGAYTVHAPNGMDVTFIDTPGHQAFTEMRARGAQVTDIAVIVVAADDGVMPQTIEAINHAKAAGVAVVIAMNKIDRDDADPDKVLRQVAEQGLQPEEWGGEVGVIPTSATTGKGIDELLDRLALEAEVLELQANHFAEASGTVLEANISEGRGVSATLLVRRGSLANGDIVVAGAGYGRVRNMTDWKGQALQIAGPSTAVEILGLSDVPKAGDRFHVLDSLKRAAEVAEQRQHQQRERELAERNSTTTLSSLFEDIEKSKKKEVRLICKADTSGSLEVMCKQLEELATDEVRVSVLHAGIGIISATDITLAEASDAIVLGFHVIAEPKARRAGEEKGVDIKTYTVIYELLDDVRHAMSGMLDPETVEEGIGHAEVLQTFKSSKFGTIAGLRVTDGKVMRDAFMRITRDGVVIHEGRVGTLRRFKEDVKEVRDGYECGLTVEKFNDIQEGDLFEFSTKKSVARTLV